MEKLCSKFSKLHVSDGHVFTVKDDVQKIKDAFFTGESYCTVVTSKNINVLNCLC